MKHGYILGGFLASAIGLVWNMSGMGGMGGLVPPGSSTHNGQSSTQGGGADENSHVPLFGQEDQNTGDSDDDIFSMFKDVDEDGNPIEDDGIDDTIDSSRQLADIPQEQVTQLQNDIRQAISQMRIPDNAIPENFDASDRTQLTQLMNTLVQSAVSQSLNVVFKPVQMAMAHQAQQMQHLVRNEMNANNTRNSAMDIIRSQVPEIDDLKYKEMLTMLDNSLKSKGKKPAERGLALRKMLNKMGVKAPANSGNGRRMSGQSNDSVGSQTKTGLAALDNLFGPMPGQQRRA